ncbi:MFS general substrate transporter [Yamadazyma tenuis ATCC 10573]|nr:MFS general substrate transporter [Yamadazyma tenuis ATCC 10573]EGV61722.1 MFS general substrate transporter [Yamadazyma tenuis ATCC 10573]
MLANWMNYGLYFTSGPLSWRFPLAFQLLFPILSIPIMFVLPESPRWLINHGRLEEGLETIAALWGKNLTIEHHEVKAEYYSIRAAIEEERAGQVPLMQVLTGRDKHKNLRRVILGAGTQFMQQFTGVNALGYYMPTILTVQLGFSAGTAKLLAACNATSYLGAALVCLIIIDKVGRRILMLYGSIGCCITYIIAAIAMKVGETRETYRMGSLTVAMFFVYYVIYGTSYAKVPWVYSSEINSIAWRTRGAAVAAATNWICGFCITQYTDIAVTNMRWGFYLLFAMIVLCYAPIVYFFYPETAKRTLEDINYMFDEYDTIFLGKHKELRQLSRPQAFIDAEFDRLSALRLVNNGKDYDEKLDTDHVEDIKSSKSKESVEHV